MCKYLNNFNSEFIDIKNFKTNKINLILSRGNLPIGPIGPVTEIEGVSTHSPFSPSIRINNWYVSYHTKSRIRKAQCEYLWRALKVSVLTFRP